MNNYSGVITLRGNLVLEERDLLHQGDGGVITNTTVFFGGGWHCAVIIYYLEWGRDIREDGGLKSICRVWWHLYRVLSIELVGARIVDSGGRGRYRVSKGRRDTHPSYRILLRRGVS